MLGRLLARLDAWAQWSFYVPLLRWEMFTERYVDNIPAWGVDTMHDCTVYLAGRVRLMIGRRRRGRYTDGSRKEDRAG